MELNKVLMHVFWLNLSINLKVFLLNKTFSRITLSYELVLTDFLNLFPRLVNLFP